MGSGVLISAGWYKMGAKPTFSPKPHVQKLSGIPRIQPCQARIYQRLLFFCKTGSPVCIPYQSKLNHIYEDKQCFPEHPDGILEPENVVGDGHQRRRNHNNLNRPGFTGERLVQILGCFFMGVQGFIEHLLCFMRCDISDGAVKALGVVPIDPFQRLPFKLAHRFPRAE